MWIRSVLAETGRLFYDSAPYFLVGFLIAGVLNATLVKRQWLVRFLGEGRRGSVFWAALIGAPLPLCSCSVIPTAVSLRRAGANKGATVSFLVSTPETSVEAVLVTYALLGPLMTVFRPIAALVLAFASGLAVNLVERTAVGGQRTSSPEAVPAPETACGCRCESPPDARESAAGRLFGRVRAMLRYSFVEFFDDLSLWLLAGLIIGGVVAGALPLASLDRLGGGPFISMLAMLAVGIPLYICASATTPVAAGLIAAGLNPGAGLVLLLVGPATNSGSLVLLARFLGKRTVAVYLLVVGGLSLAMGALLNAIVGARGLDPREMVAGGETLPSAVHIVAAAVMAGLFVASFARLARRRLAAPRGADVAV